MKLRMAKDVYNIQSIGDLNIILLAEQINLMWKLQWTYEWSQAKKRRLSTIGSKFDKLGLRKRKKNVFKVDLLGLSQLNFENISKRKKANMRKKTYNKNYISLGFDPGFTRKLLNSIKNSKSSLNNSTAVVLKNSVDSSKTKKKLKKKKVKVTSKKKKINI